MGEVSLKIFDFNLFHNGLLKQNTLKIDCFSKHTLHLYIMHTRTLFITYSYIFICCVCMCEQDQFQIKF